MSPCECIEGITLAVQVFVFGLCPIFFGMLVYVCLTLDQMCKNGRPK
jgi:hypothetical protein